MDLTPMISPLTSTDLFFRNNDDMVLSVEFSHGDWSNTTSCDVLGGLVSSSYTLHAYCQTNSTTKTIVLLRGFKGF